MSRRIRQVTNELALGLIAKDTNMVKDVDVERRDCKRSYSKFDSKRVKSGCVVCQISRQGEIRRSRMSVIFWKPVERVLELGILETGTKDEHQLGVRCKTFMRLARRAHECRETNGGIWRRPVVGYEFREPA